MVLTCDVARALGHRQGPSLFEFTSVVVTKHQRSRSVESVTLVPTANFGNPKLAMAGWRDLPNELTTHVLRLFASEEEIKVQDLVDVLSVCRRFRAIMEPLIYTTPNVRFYGYTATGQS